MTERLGFQHGASTDATTQADAERLRRERTEASMPAAQREWLDIEQRVRDEVRATIHRK